MIHISLPIILEYWSFQQVQDLPVEVALIGQECCDEVLVEQSFGLFPVKDQFALVVRDQV